MAENIIEKLEASGLPGRSGSSFPVWQKWLAVKNAVGDKKYVVCNASEGEPDVFKDKHILENYLPEVINGLVLAMETVGNATGYIYLNKDYYRLFKAKLNPLIVNMPIELFEKPTGYLAGEETVLLNAIEGKALEPRLKPPYPTEKGLWQKPTLVNNVESLFWASKIQKNEYKNERFYCISGGATKPGVFLLPESLTIKQILEQTKNLLTPPDNYFYKVGGGASGQYLLPNELNQPIKGLASIIIFDKAKTNTLQMLKDLAKFYLEANCDKCAPCREGLYRLSEYINLKGKPDFAQELAAYRDKTFLSEILAVLQKTSLCPLGRIAVLPFQSAIEKLF